jgi:hypothetical protein
MHKNERQQVYLAKKYKAQGRKYKYWLILGTWYDEELMRYIKIKRPSTSSHIKKNCNKQFRRSSLEETPIRNKGKYKRFSMYWNELF